LKENAIWKKRKVESSNWEGLDSVRVSVCQTMWIDRALKNPAHTRIHG